MLSDLMSRVLRDHHGWDVHPHPSGFVAARGDHLVMALQSGEFLLYSNATACFIAGGRGVARMVRAIERHDPPRILTFFGLPSAQVADLSGAGGIVSRAWIWDALFAVSVLFIVALCAGVRL
jgi:hypothetical protein